MMLGQSRPTRLSRPAVMRSLRSRSIRSVKRPAATRPSFPTSFIDAVPPVITAATFDRFTDTVTVTYQDNLSGLDYASITNGAFYHLSAKPVSPKIAVPQAAAADVHQRRSVCIGHLTGDRSMSSSIMATQCEAART